jgi:nucleotide-binding universal stress UspA family protein
MLEGFNNILVIIDFSSASVHGAEEAAAIAAKFSSTLHLLHISSKSSLLDSLFPKINFFHLANDNKEAYRKDKFRLEKLKIDLENRFGIGVLTHEVNGSIKEIANNYVHDLQIDLLVVGAKKRSGLQEFIFENTSRDVFNSMDTEVLFVNPGSDCSHLKKIVIPVGKFIPKRKITLAYKLARKFAARVHLISLIKTKNGVLNDDTKVLMSTYQYLKDLTNIPVECSTIRGDNIAEAAIRYAENIDADLIMVTTGTESRLPGVAITGRTGDIANHSSVPVLSVQSIDN